ncbi:unnamed protein product [Gongylonema pulchrum]|uniref:Uncharacterized protein n=1 Tax=Gongylonema pulchrum TaxID=637853 RepID=A0A183D139_9BILA|nr:unnamed protein product [Gongylonema pulchrum]
MPKEEVKENREQVAAASERDAGNGGAGGAGENDGFDECPDLTPEILKNIAEASLLRPAPQLGGRGFEKTQPPYDTVLICTWHHILTTALIAKTLVPQWSVGNQILNPAA